MQQHALLEGDHLSQSGVTEHGTECLTWGFFACNENGEQHRGKHKFDGFTELGHKINRVMTGAATHILKSTDLVSVLTRGRGRI